MLKYHMDSETNRVFFLDVEELMLLIMINKVKVYKIDNSLFSMF